MRVYRVKFKEEVKLVREKDLGEAAERLGPIEEIGLHDLELFEPLQKLFPDFPPIPPITIPWTQPSAPSYPWYQPWIVTCNQTSQ